MTRSRTATARRCARPTSGRSANTGVSSATSSAGGRVCSSSAGRVSCAHRLSSVREAPRGNTSVARSRVPSNRVPASVERVAAASCMCTCGGRDGTGPHAVNVPRSGDAECARVVKPNLAFCGLRARVQTPSHIKPPSQTHTMAAAPPTTNHHAFMQALMARRVMTEADAREMYRNLVRTPDGTRPSVFTLHHFPPRARNKTAAHCAHRTLRVRLRQLLGTV
jgi:hypothetical protein